MMKKIEIAMLCATFVFCFFPQEGRGGAPILTAHCPYIQDITQNKTQAKAIVHYEGCVTETFKDGLEMTYQADVQEPIIAFWGASLDVSQSIFTCEYTTQNSSVALTGTLPGDPSIQRFNQSWKGSICKEKDPKDCSVFLPGFY
jgi:hypothetical protein